MDAKPAFFTLTGNFDLCLPMAIPTSVVVYVHTFQIDNL